MRYNYYLKNNSVKITEAKEEEAGEGGRETVAGGKIIFEIWSQDNTLPRKTGQIWNQDSFPQGKLYIKTVVLYLAIL